MEARSPPDPETARQPAVLVPSHLASPSASPGLKDAKGYRRHDFEEAWAAYCPGQNTLQHQKRSFRSVEPSEVPMLRAHLAIFEASPPDPCDGSKNDDLSYSHAGSDASTLQNAQTAATGHSDQDADDMPSFLRRCGHCGKPGPDGRWDWPGHPDGIWLHTDCEAAWAEGR